MPVNPRLRGLREFTLLPVVHRFDGITKLSARARFHFYERDETLLLGNKIDIAPPRTKTARENFPACVFQIARGDSLA